MEPVYFRMDAHALGQVDKAHTHSSSLPLSSSSRTLLPQTLAYLDGGGHQIGVGSKFGSHHGRQGLQLRLPCSLAWVSVVLLPPPPVEPSIAATATALLPMESSSSNPGRILPLVNCPQCHVPVVKCKSDRDNVYYRCPKRCGKFWFEDAYELYLRNNLHLFESTVVPATAVEVVQHSPGVAVQGLQQVSGELKMVALDLNLPLGDIKMEIGNLRTEMKDLKEEVKKGKNPIVVDNAVVVGVFFAIMVAVLVAVVWKKN